MSDRRAPLTDEEGQRAKELYEAGMSALQVGKRMDPPAGHGAVLRVLTRQGVKLRPKTRLSDERIEQARIMYEGGWSMREVGEMLEPPVPSTTIRSAFHRYGVPVRPPSTAKDYDKLPQEQIRQTVELYERGFSTIEIGELLSIHSTAIARRLHKAGVPIRPVSERLKIAYQRGRKDRNWGHRSKAA